MTDFGASSYRRYLANSSSFQIYAFRDWQFCYLEDVYEQGLISQEDIAQLAQIHRQRNGGK